MRILRYLLLAFVAVAAVIIAIANRGPVALHLLPEGPFTEGLLAGLPNTLTLPVYVVLFAAIFLGVVLGLLLEMFRESGHRREERRYKREAAALFRDNQRLKRLAGEDEEEDLLGSA